MKNTTEYLCKKAIIIEIKLYIYALTYYRDKKNQSLVLSLAIFSKSHRQADLADLQANRS